MTADYFAKRVKEIFDKRYSGQDVWVSRWELDGIMHYIKNAKDNKDNILYKRPVFEHGTEAPAMHPIGSQKLLHMHVEVQDKNNDYIKRHLLITDNPTDSRLRFVGIGDKGRVNSKVYTPKHPTFEGKVYRRVVEITYEKRKEK